MTATLTGASFGGVGQKRPRLVLVEVPLLRGERLGVVERGAAAGTASDHERRRAASASGVSLNDERGRDAGGEPVPGRAANAVGAGGERAG